VTERFCEASLTGVFSVSFDTFIFYAVAAMTGLCAVAVVVTQNIVRSAAWLLFTLGGTSAIFFLLGADFVAATQLIVYVGGTLVLVVFGVMLTAQGPFITMKSSPAEWAIATLVGLLFLGVLIGSILSDTTWKHTNQPRDTNAVSQTSTVALGESLLGVDAATPESNLIGADATVKRIDRDRGLLVLMDSGGKEVSLPVARDVRVRDEKGREVPGGLKEIQEGLRISYKPDQPELTVIFLGNQQRKQMNYLLPFEIVSVHLLVVLIGAAYLARAKRRRGAES